MRITKTFENMMWYLTVDLQEECNFRLKIQFLWLVKLFKGDSSVQFTFTRELCNDSSLFFSWLIQFITFIALQNTLILQHSCKNQPWSPFVTPICQLVCILWTTCKVSLVEQACITLERVNLKRYATVEDCHTKTSIPWQIQGMFSALSPEVPCSTWTPE